MEEKEDEKNGNIIPPFRMRENVILLKRQGWTVEEISKAFKNVSKEQVELIIELDSRGWK